MVWWEDQGHLFDREEHVLHYGGKLAQKSAGQDNHNNQLGGDNHNNQLGGVKHKNLPRVKSRTISQSCEGY